MPVLGAVLTLSSADRPAVPADPRLTVGEQVKNRLPVVIETTSRGEERAILDALTAVPGVVAIDVAFHDFSDLTGVSP